MKRNLIGLVALLILLGVGYYFLQNKPITLQPEQNGEIPTDQGSLQASENSPKALKIVSPDGGENWIAGTTHAIKWSLDYGGKISPDISLVLYDAAQEKDGPFIASAKAANGSYDWNIPADTKPGNYEILGYGDFGGDKNIESFVDYSDHWFTISAPSKNLLYESGDDMNGTHVGYVRETGVGSTYYLTIDYIQFVAPCTNEDCPGGFKILNTNSQVRSFPVTENEPVIRMQTYSTDVDGGFIPSQIPFQSFVNMMRSGMPQYPANDPYQIVIKNGIVTEINEIYLP